MPDLTCIFHFAQEQAGRVITLALYFHDLSQRMLSGSCWVYEDRRLLALFHACECFGISEQRPMAVIALSEASSRTQKMRINLIHGSTLFIPALESHFF
jgi:hypothetical protein